MLWLKTLFIEETFQYYIGVSFIMSNYFISVKKEKHALTIVTAIEYHFFSF